MTGKQRGGTVLGLILGALVGLGVALAVAVYITKMPVPFTNKALPDNAGRDAAETMKNKDWDPNTTLAGGNPAKPKLPASSEASGNAAAPAVAVPQPDVPAVPKVPPVSPQDKLTTPAMPAAPVKSQSDDPLGDLAKSAAARPAQPAVPAKGQSADPLGDLARSVSVPAIAVPAARPATLTPATLAPDPFTYFVQAGAFRTQEEAGKQHARLQALGMHARLTEREQAGRTVYRVRIGPFDRKVDADNMTEKLRENSIDAALVRVQR